MTAQTSEQIEKGLTQPSSPEQPKAVVDAISFVDARVTPRGSLENLSHEEVAKLLDRGQGGLYPILRQCALAVLNSGSYSDDPRALFEQYRDFELKIVQQSWGIKLEIRHAPGIAFVEGEMIRGVKEHLFAVLRDIVYTANEIVESGRFDLTKSDGITNAVFHILRNAHVLDTRDHTDLVVCWGGHSIGREEYDYTKKVGYELGLRGLNVCTGCGPGAMKGPMKGATIGHAKQRIVNGRYIGLTEPGIVAAEPPNPIVNHLVIMPDIEKRLEAFVRLGHGIIIFPGGVGTTEEILYLLGLLLDPANADQPMPLVLTGPASSASYFKLVDDFIGVTLGPAAQKRYSIIIDDPAEAARTMVAGVARVRQHRTETGESYNFNWSLRVPEGLQMPFEVTHEAVAALDLHLDQPVHARAANLRRVFSALVAGNVRAPIIKEVEARGPFEISGDPRLMGHLDTLLAAFVAEKRMKLSGDYHPVYRVISQ
jgi:predicted Rossmann-fold nucleotide-binding protein